MKQTKAAEPASLAETGERAADHVLRDAGAAPVVILGPVVYSDDPPARKAHWYFVVAASGGDGGFHVNSLGSQTAELADMLRNSLMVALAARRSIVIHDTDDELAAAKLCAAHWPGARAAATVAAIEAERAA